MIERCKRCNQKLQLYKYQDEVSKDVFFAIWCKNCGFKEFWESKEDIFKKIDEGRMNNFIREYDEGDTVWFVDSDLKNDYPEHAEVIAFTKKGDVVINGYFGMGVFPKQDIFATKEESKNLSI